MSEIVWSWDGSVIDGRTTPAGAVWSVNGWELGPAESVTGHKPVELIEAMVDTTEAVQNPVRPWRLSIKSLVAGISASNPERKLIKGWEELAEAFDCTQGVAKLQAARKDTAGGDVTRYLIAEITDTPSYIPGTGARGSGVWAEGGYEGEGGWINYVVRGRTLFPRWIGSALLNQDTAPATAELAVGASTDTVTINNAGARWVGVKFTVGSVSGSVTQWKVENDANSDVLTVSNAGPFANGDIVDCLATDPRKVTVTDANNLFTGAGHNRMRLETGSQTLTCTRLAGTGTLTLSLAWPYLARSL